jgi:serine/threonine protein kinase
MQKGNSVGSGIFGDIYKIISSDKCTTCNAPLNTHVVKINKLRDYYLLREIVIQLGIEGHPAIAQICAIDPGPIINNFTQPNYGQTLHNVIMGQVSTAGTSLATAKYFAEMLGIVKDVLSGLNYLHAYNIAHGDISPSNIMVQRGEASTAPRGIIIDFGCSKRLSNDTETTYVNCYLFRPPEVFAAKDDLCNYETSVDIWALGCCIMAILGSYRTKETDLFLNYVFYNKDFEDGIICMYRALYPEDRTMINKIDMQKILCALASSKDSSQSRLDTYLTTWLKKKSPIVSDLITKDTAITELYSMAQKYLVIDPTARAGFKQIAHSQQSTMEGQNSDPNNIMAALAFKDKVLLRPILMASANRIFMHIRPKLTQVDDMIIQRASALVAAAIHSVDYQEFARKFVKEFDKNAMEMFKNDVANDVRKCLDVILKSDILKKEVQGQVDSQKS